MGARWKDLRMSADCSASCLIRSFQMNGYGYVYYADKGENRNRVSRFTASEDLANGVVNSLPNALTTLTVSGRAGGIESERDEVYDAVVSSSMGR